MMMIVAIVMSATLLIIMITIGTVVNTTLNIQYVRSVRTLFVSLPYYIVSLKLIKNS